MDKTYALFRNVFGGFGLVLVGAGLVWAFSLQQFKTGALRAEGVVVDLRRSSDSSSRAPVVVFTPTDGREVRLYSNVYSSPPAFERGERVTVLYDPAAPEDGTVDSFSELWMGPMIVAGVGLPFFCIGLGFFIAAHRARVLRQEMRERGRRIQAQFVGVHRNARLKVNGRSPWRLEAQWVNPATQKVHVFRSENLWFDPSPYVKGPHLSVLIDPENPKRYWLDASFLPALDA